jgi:hypothetical protein
MGEFMLFRLGNSFIDPLLEVIAPGIIEATLTLRPWTVSMLFKLTAFFVLINFRSSRSHVTAFMVNEFLIDVC